MRIKTLLIIISLCISAFSCLTHAGVKVHIPDNLTFCGETVPLDKSDVKERLTTQLMIFQNKEVQMTLWYQRLNRFFPTIERIIKERGLPEDLKYVCVIESSLITRARSASNAVGPWQFLSGTAREYGLKVSGYMDERMHLEKATHAALDYLKNLRDEFGSWSMALAGYNAGNGRLKHEVYRQGSSDYYELELPLETERYVFNAISVKLILENPELYGYDFSEVETYDNPQSESILVRLDNFVPVKILSWCADLSYREFSLLNTWIRGVNLKKGVHEISIPIKGETKFRDRLDRYFKKLNGYKGYPNGVKVMVKDSDGAMRVGPGMEYPVFRTLDKGDRFRVKGRTSIKEKGHYWYIFKLGDGSSGWIWGGELKIL